MLNSSLFYKFYEKFFMNDYLKFLKENFIDKKIFFKDKKLIIFDVGCYRGTFSQSLSRFFLTKKTDFYLFDPLIDLIKSKNYKKKNFKLFKYALDSGRPSKKIFYLNNFLYASGSSLNGSSFKDKKYKFSRNFIAFFLNPFKKMVSTIKVNTNSIDYFCQKKKIKRINILKIDTEGTEIDVLLGAKRMIKNTSIVCIEIQMNKKKIQSKIKKIKNFLKNFNLVYKEKIVIASLFTNLVSYDCIFVQKKINKLK